MSSDRARIVLLGLGPTTATAIEGLVEAFEIACVVRDAPEGDEAIELASRRGIAVARDTALPDVVALIGRHEPDAVVVSSYDRILPADLVAERPFVNVHYAPLPRYRGRATVNWAIINGEPEASISIHTLAPGLDAGGILYQDAVPIGPRDTVTDVYDALNELQRRAIAAAVSRRLTGDEGDAQDERLATYACTRVPDDGEIDWTAPSAAIDRLVRALTDPFPGAFTWLGLRRLRVLRAAPVADAPVYEGCVPGRVVRVARSDGWVDVLTGDGVLRLHEVALDDAAPVAAPDAIRSVKQTLGLRSADVVALLRRLAGAA